MTFEINRTSVRQMAARLGNRFPQASRSYVYETLAQLFGHPNWDTFSGLLKEAEGPSKEKALKARPTWLYVPAYSTSEFGDSPSWAKVLVNQEFLSELDRLSRLCEQNKLEHCAVDAAPEAWQENESDPLRIRYDSLYVDKSSWWFRAMPKHADYSVETRALDIALLKEVLLRNTPSDWLQRRGDVLIYSGSGNIDGFYEELILAEEVPEPEED